MEPARAQGEKTAGARREAEDATARRLARDREEATRRAAQLAEEVELRRRERAAREARDRGRRPETAQQVRLAVSGVVPVLTRRTFDQWERLHPEMTDWALTEDWGWLDGFDPIERRAGRWMAYVVDQLYLKATVHDLRHPELSDAAFEALVRALFARGLARDEANSKDGRWERVVQTA